MADYDVDLVAFSDLVWETTPDEATVELVDYTTLTYETTPDEATVELVGFSDLVYEATFNETGGVTQTVVNRVWDTVAAGFVRWVTDNIDSSGTQYPGPGTFGVHTSDYMVETIHRTGV